MSTHGGVGPQVEGAGLVVDDDPHADLCGVAVDAEAPRRGRGWPAAEGLTCLSDVASVS